MGRKVRATKQVESRKQTSAIRSPCQVQTSAAGGNLVQKNSEPSFSGTSRSSRKKSKSATVTTRRSQRNKKITCNQDIEPVIQEIDINESDKEEHVDEENKSPDESSDKTERSHKDKENESPHQSSDETKRTSQKEKEKKENPYHIYKSMYISSQKKIEALLHENRELTKNLEHTCGKADVFEKPSHIYSEVMSVIASLCKVNENLSAQVKDGATSEGTEVDGRVSKKRKTR